MPSVSITKFLGVSLLLCSLSSGCAEEVPPSLEFLRYTCVNQGDENSCVEFKARTGETPERTPDEIQAEAEEASEAAAQAEASAPARAKFEAEQKAKEPSVPVKVGCFVLEGMMSMFTGGMEWDCHLREIHYNR